MKDQDEAMEPRAVESASEPVSKRQPRVWPPTHWGEWTYQPKEAVSLDDADEPSMEELLSRGGKKVG
jgi:hypothetical protein